MEASGRIAIQINLEDISFWFSEIESEMLLANVQSQWLKLSVLRKNLPVKQREDVKSLLRLKKSEAGPTPYFDVKTALLKIYELKPKDSYKKALGRVLVGLPSQLGKQIVDDICDKPIKLQGCCCAKAAHALWSLQLPVNINQHVSNMQFNVNTYQSVFDAADQVFLSAKSLPSATVAAATASQTPPGFSMTASANDPLNTAFGSQVAAVNRGRGRGGRNRGQRGNGRGNRGNQRNTMKKKP